nr:helix-turn-helix domain-containing protein [Microvirga splendida]
MRPSGAPPHDRRKQEADRDDHEDAGLVIDGRERLLRDLVWRIYLYGERRPTVIAEKAWAEFERRADQIRGKRDGPDPWTYDDALTKAEEVVRRQKLPDHYQPLPHEADGFWTPERKTAFDTLVAATAALGQLSPTAVRVSGSMLRYVTGDSSCFAAVNTLASHLKVNRVTVKRARADLLRLGFWICRDRVGGRHKQAHYEPNRNLVE